MVKVTERAKKMMVVPDDYSDIDHIGYIEHSAGLVEMVRSVQSKGAFTIGVFGQWGQGKTSMLRQIQRELMGTTSNHEKEILTVWFNPWQFAGEEHVIVPFFHTLVSYAREFMAAKQDTGTSVTGKIADFFKVLVRVPWTLASGLQGSIKLPMLLQARFNIKDAIGEAKMQKALKDPKPPDSQLAEAIAEHESMYYRLISTLRTAADGMDLKIVVFIDDLDRCLPEKAVELLEGLKVLLDIPGFVFVIGVAREVIERGIRVRYKGLYSVENNKMPFLEQDYLDKIIQFPFTLPPPDVAKLNAMIAGYLENIEDAKPYLDTIQKALGMNPRSLKRFVNNLSFVFWVTGKKVEQGDEPFQPELLVKMTLIAFKFPALYRVAGKTPVHLLRVQAFIDTLARKDKEKEKAMAEPVRGTGSGTQRQTATGFIEIDELNLFEPPHLESISQILGKHNREGAEPDKGFTTEKEVRRYMSLLTATSAAPQSPAGGEPGATGLWQTIESRMVFIEGGTIKMKDEDSGSQFSTGIKPFHLDKYPVTQDLYEKIMGKDKNRSRFPGGDRPVENVSWFDAVQFCNKLSEKVGLKTVYNISGESVTADFDASGFRLPTEAEWEYACRAGTKGKTYGKIDQIAWSKENSDGTTQGVGQKGPNAWGLYDMLGNVWEWCWDRFGRFPSGEKDEWRGPETGDDRVFRGGSWNNSAQGCRASFRLDVHPSFKDHDLGFRLATSV